jgi:hypothetical protein
MLNPLSFDEAGNLRMSSQEFRRIRMFRSIIRKAMLTCVIAIALTLLDNIVYCLAFYVYPNVTTSDGKYLIWFDVYTWVLNIESLICGLLPMLNYKRLKHMCTCLGHGDEQEADPLVIKRSIEKTSFMKTKSMHQRKITLEKSLLEGQNNVH